jgi:purine-binding chemotaxis protein CheW
VFAYARDTQEAPAPEQACKWCSSYRDNTGMSSVDSRRTSAPEAGNLRGDSKNIQLVGFRLDGDDYGIPITKIQEIILMKPVTRVPQVPAFIEGLINLRGVVIPVINLRKRFGLPEREIDDETRTIVLSLHDKTVGCIVDHVTHVMRLAGDQIQPAPVTVLATARNYITGLAQMDDRLLIVLDVEKLFDPAELVVEPVSNAESPALTQQHR